MRYAILANPLSGKLTVEQKYRVLEEAAGFLHASIHGLDTRSAAEFGEQARQLAQQYDVLVVAGGDGTFSQMINTLDLNRIVLAYLPLGTGNAMGHALRYRGSLAHKAARIKQGPIREYDLVDCDGKMRAFMASVGFDGLLIRLRDGYLKQGATGFIAYLKAGLKAYFRQYRPTRARLSIDGETLQVENLLSLMVVKQPYFGFRINAVPEARFDDRWLHTRWVCRGFLPTLYGLVTAVTLGNRAGQYRKAHHVDVRLGRPLILQIDGNDAWEAEAFSFEVLPRVLKMKC